MLEISDPETLLDLVPGAAFYGKGDCNVGFARALYRVAKFSCFLYGGLGDFW